MLSTPSISRIAASASAIFASVYSRLEPMGVFMRMNMMPSSCCGTNSVPTSGTIAKLPKNERPAISSSKARGPTLTRRLRP
jgi:hypothetical protein